MSPSKVCPSCHKALALTVAGLCALCTSVIAVDETGPALMAQVVAARQEAGEQPHTELMEPRFEAEPILTYATTSDPMRVTGWLGRDVLRGVDPERSDEPHTPEREADPGLMYVSMASYAVTGTGAPVATDEAITTAEPSTPFMNRAARRAAQRQQRKNHNRPGSARPST